MARDNQVRRYPWLRLSIRTAVLAFFVFFFVLMSSGRMGSFDAGQQLSSAMLAVTRHDLGTRTPPNPDFWVAAPNGVYYEPHDLGATLLMLPGALIGAKLSHASVDEMVKNPPLISKVGVALTYSLFYALGCYFLFLLFSEFYTARQAFLIAFVFAAGTFFLPYAKVTWDVAPCAAAMCAFLYYAQGLSRPGASPRTFIAAGLWLAIACTFRYSLAPGLVVAVACLAWRTRGSLPRYVLLGATFAVGMIPTFVYNAVRTGQFLRPATASDYYLKGGNAMDGNILHGLAGLLFSPNRGLLLFCPIVVAVLVLPWVWRNLSSRQRTLIQSMTLGMLIYMVVIAKLNHWGTFGWGPRYLVPCLPVLFLAVGPCLLAIASTSRVAAAVVVIAAVCWNVAPATTNWHVIMAEYPGSDQQDATYPYATEGIWKGFWMGMHGETLMFAGSDPRFAQQDEGRRFPDFWTSRLIERGPSGLVAGWGLTLALLLGMAAALARLFGDAPKRTGDAEPKLVI